VTVANREGARRAVAHLAGLGHRAIAMLSGPEGLSTARERQAGFVEEMQALRLSRCGLEHGDFRPAGGRAAMERLLARRPRPTAVFVANDLMALGAYEAARASGVRVPGDVAIVSFDDAPWAAWLDPPLTTVAQPAYELGAGAARLLMSRLEMPGEGARRVVLETRLVVRGSCGGTTNRSGEDSCAER
jgi:LacI family transcriptional regulator